METLANGYSTNRIQQELSNEYQHDRVFKRNFEIFCHHVPSVKVDSALKELKYHSTMSE